MSARRHAPGKAKVGYVYVMLHHIKLLTAINIVWFVGFVVWKWKGRQKIKSRLALKGLILFENSLRATMQLMTSPFAPDGRLHLQQNVETFVCCL